jgi:uncharacterized RDD family membrane protein YckC
MTTPQDPNPMQGGGAGSEPVAGDGSTGGYGPAGGYAGAPGAPSPDDGQPPGYGPPPGYGQPTGYGMPGVAGAPSPFGQPGGPQLADWGLRVQSALVDFVGPSIVASFVGLAVNRTLGNLLTLVALGWALYNAYLQGDTGQSVGKKMVGTRLLREQDGQVIGGGLGIGRYFLHILDALPCYVGFLWPLWDDKKQTFADKIVKSVVIKA